jgi:hypothetical protein
MKGEQERGLGADGGGNGGYAYKAARRTKYVPGENATNFGGGGGGAKGASSGAGAHGVVILYWLVQKPKTNSSKLPEGVRKITGRGKEHEYAMGSQLGTLIHGEFVPYN